jgi:hypothetical protein
VPLPAPPYRGRLVNRERRLLVGYLVVLAVLGAALVWGIANCGQ